ncbi:MAG: M16 family metallopeptidase, partial [Polyangiaceae bacterium]
AVAPGGSVPDAVPEPTMRPGRHLLLADKPERTQTQILVGTLGTSAHDEDHVPLVVANAVFGGTFTSRLMREVRSKRGWSYGASARTGVDRHRQSWVMWTFPAAEDAAPCLALTLKLMEAWVTGGVTPREISFIQRYLVRSHAFEVDTAAKRLHQALDVELLSLPADYYSSWTDRVRAVTPEAASAAVRNRIHPQDVLAVVVGTASQVLEPLKAAVPGLAAAKVVPFDAE